ncbi:MAG TPA: DinB family protein [Candidatus Limnocylindria bacterium]|nr:DinB family protein [Candidatus Limnocylindria bacterium]
MPSDPVAEGTREVLEESLGEIRKGVADLSVDQLNARPAGGDTNSVAVIVAHALGSTRSWLSLAFGLPQPPRDRPGEFRTIADESFAAWTEDMIQQIFGLLEGATFDPTLSAVPGWNPQHGAQPRTSPYSLGHALAHLGEHVGHLHMTRELLRPES